jgi:hypothetical protein
MKHLLDIPGYDSRAFLPTAGRMRLYGGKSSAPAAPDYIGQANAQAAGNLDAARSATSANRVDQDTPYGSIKYTQGDGFDQAGYDAAMTKYNADQAALDANPNGAQMRTYLKTIGQDTSAPDRTSFITNPDHWSSAIQLSDTGQQLLDAYNQTSLGMANLQGGAMDRVNSALSQPFDTSGLQDISGTTGMDGWDKASGLIMQRMNPDLDVQQAALDTKLANQGLTAGSEGWGTQQYQFGKQRNDANVAAQLAGSQVQNQMFNQAVTGNQAILQQRNFIRQQPLNELNALRTGAAVTNPTFMGGGQQGQTSGPDLLGASSSQYNAALGNTNAQNAQAAQTTSAGVGLVGAGLSAWGTAAGYGAVSFF